MKLTIKYELTICYKVRGIFIHHIVLWSFQRKACYIRDSSGDDANALYKQARTIWQLYGEVSSSYRSSSEIYKSKRYHLRRSPRTAAAAPRREINIHFHTQMRRSGYNDARAVSASARSWQLAPLIYNSLLLFEWDLLIREVWNPRSDPAKIILFDRSDRFWTNLTLQWRPVTAMI